MLQNVIKEIFIITVFFLKKLTQKVFRACAPFCITPHTEPAFFLQKVEEGYLSQQFLGKVNSVDAFCLKISSDFGIVLQHLIQFFFCADEKFTVFNEKFFCNSFNVKRLLQFSKGWAVFIICQYINQSALCSMAVFICTNKK